MNLTDDLAKIVGPTNVLTGADTARFTQDWTQQYTSDPIAVVRPANTQEVSALMTYAHANDIAVVPVSGNTGLAGGTYSTGAVAISMDRMNAIREIRTDARIAVVEAGVVLSNLHDACEAEGLVFPLTLGAKGSAMIGGLLSTNAGGSNVVRYGSTRGLCLGIEVVLADGRIMDLMTELHKDNSGYDLCDLFIGAEGTLGLITGAVVKLFPKPAAYATAMVAAPSLREALVLLNKLQIATGGLVEAFEFMPGNYVKAHLEKIEGARPPFEDHHEINIMVEVAATAPKDCMPNDDGSIPLVDQLQETLAEMLEDGSILDAVVAQNDTQRREIWKRREDAAEVQLDGRPAVHTDIALPTDHVPLFFERMAQVTAEYDPGADDTCVAHLGDGNIHYSVFPTNPDAAFKDGYMERIEDLVKSLGGSFSAEHGIGLSKKPSMARRKDPVAIDVMRAIKSALDPKNILNPGKVLPDQA